MLPANLLILHNNESGTFCIDCTSTPVSGAAVAPGSEGVSKQRMGSGTDGEGA